MNKHWFLLGRENLLAASELDAVLNLKKFSLEKGILKTETKINPDVFIKQVGGVVKIGKELADHLTKEDLVKKIIEELREVKGKIIFGLSFYDTPVKIQEARQIGLKIKKSLKEEGLSSRFVNNNELTLSSVSVDKNRLLKRGKEFLIDFQNNKFSLAQTKAVQPFEEFSRRDYGRPGRDSLSGMLPPKLSMMMINLSRAKKDKILLDPFCGSGTILTEALILGYKKLIGNDISKQAIEDTGKNLEWIIKMKGIDKQETEIKLLNGEVEKIGEKIKGEKVGAIVAEPFMGKPLHGNEKEDTLKKRTEELKKLYIEAFKSFKKILKKDGVVVFIFPRYKSGENWISSACVEENKKLGFKTEPFLNGRESLVYYREGQFLAREIYRFTV